MGFGIKSTAILYLAMFVSNAQSVEHDQNEDVHNEVESTLLATMSKKLEHMEKEMEAMKGKMAMYEKENSRKRRFILDTELETGPIAFSAYVTQYQNQVGLHQVIKFDGVLLNDGAAYNKQTGVFTCPASGVYLVSFFIADRDVNQVLVQLTVDSVGVSDAAAETIQSRHIDQGGNVVLLHLNKGQSVWVEVEDHDGVHIEGASDWRFTTFSALLLYQS